jgi:hypothetical protein
MQWLSASDANFVQNSQLQNDEAVGSIPASDIRTIAEDEESQCQRSEVPPFAVPIAMLVLS